MILVRNMFSTIGLGIVQQQAGSHAKACSRPVNPTVAAGHAGDLYANDRAGCVIVSNTSMCVSCMWWQSACEVPSMATVMPA